MNPTSINETNSQHQNINLNTSKPKPIIPVIIDNIKSTKTHNEIINNLNETFNQITFTTKKLNKGGIVITPSEQHQINSFLKIDKYNPEFFGNKLDIHLAGADRDLRPWMCINKIALDTNLDEIQHQLESFKTTHNIEITALHRKQKGPYDTTLILFKTTDHIAEDTLLNEHIIINNTKCKIRKYINAGQIRCTKCQKIGHLKHSCKNTKTCVMCAGDKCPVGTCKNTYRKCVNCSLDHSSAFKNCPAIKSHKKESFNIKRHKSFEEHITVKHNNLTTTQTQYNEDLNKIKDNQVKLNDILTSLREQIDTLNDIIKNLQINHTNEITKLTTQLNEQTQLNVELKDNINTQNTLINDITKRLDTHIVDSTDNFKNLTTNLTTQNELTIDLQNEIDLENDTFKKLIKNIEKYLTKTITDVVENKKYIADLRDNDKITQTQLKKTTKLIEHILPLTHPDNLVIFLGHIITNTDSRDTLQVNTDTINKIAKKLNKINITPKDGAGADGGEGNDSFNTRSQRYIKD